MNTKLSWMLAVFTVTASLQSSTSKCGTLSLRAHISQRRHTTRSVAKFYGLGATGVISVYDDSLKALLIDSNGKAMIWSPHGGKHPIFTHFSDLQAISGDGKHILVPVIEHANGPGPGEGRYYGHYTVWGDGFGQYPVAPKNTISYQMGMTWQFSLSDDGQRVLVYDEDTTSTLYAFNSGARKFQPLRVKEGVVEYSDRRRTLARSRFVGLSPDGTVIVTAQGDRYKITDHFTKLPDQVSSSLMNKINGNSAQISVSEGANHIAAMVFDGPRRTNENEEEFDRKLVVHLVTWDQHHGLQTIADLGDGHVYGSLHISNDGNTIVGPFNRGSGNEPFIWTASHDFQTLPDVLREVGLNASTRGWQFQKIAWMSKSGRTIAGEGINPKGNHESWIVFLPKEWPKEPVRHHIPGDI